MPPGFHYPGRRRRLAAAALGHDAAQPRRALHGSRRAHEARRHRGAGPGRGRHPDRAVPDRVPADQSRLGHAAGAAARRDARLLPPGAVGAARRGRRAADDRLHQRGVAAAHARPLARARGGGQSRAGRDAAPAGAAAHGRGPDPRRRRGGARSGASPPAALPLLRTYTPVSVPRLTDAAVDVRTLGAALAVIVGATAVLRAGAGPGLAQAAADHRAEDGGAGQFARRAPALLGAGRRRAGAGLRAARRLGAAGAHGAADDRDAHRRGRRRRGHDAHPGAAGAGATRPRSSPAGRAMAAQHTAILDAVRREPGVQAAGRHQLPAVRGRLARAVPDRRRPAAAAPRGCAAGAVAQRQRRLLRGDGRPDRRRPRLRRVRRPRRARASSIVNETFARRYLANRAAGGHHA